MLRRMKAKNNFTAKKGFTLVELMIVLAVIALLIVVLLPRIGPIKNKSRETGIKTNMAMLEGIIMSNIDDFAADATGVTNFEAKVASDIDTVVIANQRMKNPISGGTDVDNDASAVVAATAVAYSTGDNADLAAVNTEWTATLANSAGCIAYGAYVSSSKITVLMIPYGVDNKRITTLEKTLSQ